MTVNPISRSNVQSAIAAASQRTGVDFSYLLGQAKIESGLNANARAGTSSASGLYQFIEQSWLAVVKKHGAEHGLGWAADSIGRTAGGRLTVTGGNRQAILGLRNDPAAASLMAAEHASDNKDAIEGTLGRAATGTDLYMAHFLGLGGAKQFLSAMQANPDRAGASMFPAAARANRSIFYGAGGQPRSLNEIYNRFAAKLETGAAGASDAQGATLPQMQFAAQALDLDGSTVITGTGESATTALAWASSTMDRFRDRETADANRTMMASMMRPTPDNARLAYLMLASMGA